jgi:hypothetical protein
MDKSTGLGKITYSVSPNNGAARREGILTVTYIKPDTAGVFHEYAPKSGAPILKQFTVKQDGKR